MKDRSETHYFECMCRAPYHLIRIDIEDWDDKFTPDLIIYNQLSTYLSWWKRILVAFKYVFGIERQNCDYSDTVLDEKKATELRDMLNRYLDLCRERAGEKT